MATPLHTVRSDHTGALRMPEWLRDQYVEHYDGRIDDAALRESQNRAVAEVIRRQEEIGLPVVTDGEFLRDGDAGWFTSGSTPRDVRTPRIHTASRLRRSHLPR